MRSRTYLLTVAVCVLGMLLPAAVAHASPAHDGDPATTERLSAVDRVGTAIEVSRARFPEDPASWALLSRYDDFADALAGSSLSADGPLLYTSPNDLDHRVREELQRVLADGSTVYLLGGEHALSSDVEEAVSDAGFDPVRLAGASRTETSVAIAEETRARFGDNGKIAVARGWARPDDASGTSAWADAIAVGSWTASSSTPLLITHHDHLSGETSDGPDADGTPARWLADDQPGVAYLMGGEVALTAELAADVDDRAGNVQRMAGETRQETATLIAEELHGQQPNGPRSYVVFNGFHSAGWIFGLAAAGLGDPLLLVSSSPDSVSGATREAVTGDCEVDILLVGGQDMIPEDVEERIDSYDPCPDGGGA